MCLPILLLYKTVCYYSSASECALLICLTLSSFGRDGKSFQCFFGSECCRNTVFPRNPSSGGKVCVGGGLKANLGKVVEGEPLNHQQVTGRRVSTGRADVSLWEGGWIWADGYI